LNEETRHAKVESEENWDDEDAPDYNPEVYVATANVVREAKGLFPSQRKAFIKEERKRLLNEESDDDRDQDHHHDKEAPARSTNTNTRISTSSSSTSHRATPYNIANRRR